MTETPTSPGSRRSALGRGRVVHAAVRYIDTHGLGGLSMHKLGRELGVQAMSLYNHVANKDDLLNGVVEALWTEVEANTPATPDWREGYRVFAHALRDAVRRHPNVAPVITGQKIIPEPALRCVQTRISAATASGVPEERAYALLRTITSYTLGTALNEVTWNTGTIGSEPTPVGDLVSQGTPEGLVGVAKVFCGQSDPDAEFELGLALMLRYSERWSLRE